MIALVARLRKWAEEVNAAYADGGYAAGDGPIAPDPDDILKLLDVVEAAQGITEPNWMEADTREKSKQRLIRAMRELEDG